MSKCWAAILGDCEGPISREHLISESVLPDSVAIKGLPWCEAEEKVISRRRLVAKILCKKHNSMLSELDSAAMHAFQDMREFHRMAEVRSRIKRRIWTVKTFKVDGIGLERWLLKTIIDVIVANGGAQEWHLSETPATHPPEALVHAAYGVSDLEAPIGLYAVAKYGQKAGADTAFHIRMLNDEDGRVAGAFFEHLGFRFLLWLTERQAPLRFPSGLDLGMDADGADLLRHVRSFRRTQNRSLSLEIEFDWGP